MSDQLGLRVIECMPSKGIVRPQWFEGEGPQRLACLNACPAVGRMVRKELGDMVLLEETLGVGFEVSKAQVIPSCCSLSLSLLSSPPSALALRIRQSYHSTTTPACLLPCSVP